MQTDPSSNQRSGESKKRRRSVKIANSLGVFLTALVGQPVLVELKNNTLVEGVLVEAHENLRYVPNFYI